MWSGHSAGHPPTHRSPTALIPPLHPLCILTQVHTAQNHAATCAYKVGEHGLESISMWIYAKCTHTHTRTYTCLSACRQKCPKREQSSSQACIGSQPRAPEIQIKLSMRKHTHGKPSGPCSAQGKGAGLSSRCTAKEPLI